LARPYDDTDLSSSEFWYSTAAEREWTFAQLRATNPLSWHRPVEKLLIEDPNDQDFWAVVSHAGLVEVTKRHSDFLSGEDIVMESMPQELLDASQGLIAMDPPRHQGASAAEFGVRPETDHPDQRANPCQRDTSGRRPGTAGRGGLRLGMLSAAADAQHLRHDGCARGCASQGRRRSLLCGRVERPRADGRPPPNSARSLPTSSANEATIPNGSISLVTPTRM
jgi:hypothetical protein